LSDLERSRLIGRQMHMIPAMRHKPLLPNAVQETLGGAVK